MRAVTAEVLLLLGSVLMLLAAVGMIRFGDVLARMHALSKGSNFGLLLALAGGAIGMQRINDISFVILAGVFQMLTAPVATQLIGRATYRATNTRLNLRQDAADTEADDPAGGGTSR